MASEARRRAGARGERGGQARPGVMTRAVRGLGAIPVIGQFISAALVFGPGFGVTLAYDVMLMRLRAGALGRPTSEIGSNFFEWFPTAPRAALALAASTLFVFGLTTILWGRMLRNLRAPVRMFLLPARWWGRLIVLAAALLLVAGFVWPDRVRSLIVDGRVTVDAP